MGERALSTGAVVGIVVGVVVSVIVPVSIVVVLLGGGFGGGGVSLATPQDTITSAFNALNAYDADALYSCLSSNAHSQMSLDNVRERIQMYENIGAKITGLQISNVNITDNTATATVSGRIEYISEGLPASSDLVPINYLLVKESNLWKLENFVL